MVNPDPTVGRDPALPALLQPLLPRPAVGWAWRAGDIEEVRDLALHLPPLEQGCSPWRDGQMDRRAVSHRNGHHQDPGHAEAQGGSGRE